MKSSIPKIHNKAGNNKAFWLIVKTHLTITSRNEKKSLPLANEVWGKVIFSQVCVSHSVFKGRGSPWQTPPGQRPPWTEIPWTDTPLDRNPTCTVKSRPVRILLECILVTISFMATFCKSLKNSLTHFSDQTQRTPARLRRAMRQWCDTERRCLPFQHWVMLRSGFGVAYSTCLPRRVATSKSAK